MEKKRQRQPGRFISFVFLFDLFVLDSWTLRSLVFYSFDFVRSFVLRARTQWIIYGLVHIKAAIRQSAIKYGAHFIWPDRQTMTRQWMSSCKRRRKNRNDVRLFSKKTRHKRLLFSLIKGKTGTTRPAELHTATLHTPSRGNTPPR